MVCLTLIFNCVRPIVKSCAKQTVVRTQYTMHIVGYFYKALIFAIQLKYNQFVF